MFAQPRVLLLLLLLPPLALLLGLVRVRRRRLLARVGRVAFAGDSYVACPLTLDYSAAKIFLDVLDPSLIPLPGTAVASAIRKSTRAFNSAEKRYKVLVLITDGEDHEEDAVAAAKEA